MGAVRAGLLGGAAVLDAAALATAATVQEGGLRVTVLGQVQPFRLPRDKAAPVAVFVSGHLAAPGGGTPPQLKQLTIDVNRHGRLGSTGLPACRLKQIDPASTERALANCGPALIGSGQFWAHIVLPGQDPYPTHGRLLVFNGSRGGRPALFAHIYTQNPFNASFVVAFGIEHLRRGLYGTRLHASLPETLGEWGYVDRIKLTLRRRYSFKGIHRSYFRASCPAPTGTRIAPFRLARISFDLGDRSPVRVGVQKTCGVKGR